MECHIKIMMSKQDYETVQQIFEESEGPKFTIVNAEQRANDCVYVELYAESFINFWHLAKLVQLKECGKILTEIVENK